MLWSACVAQIIINYSCRFPAPGEMYCMYRCGIVVLFWLFCFFFAKELHFLFEWADYVWILNTKIADLASNTKRSQKSVEFLNNYVPENGRKSLDWSISFRMYL